MHILLIKNATAEKLELAQHCKVWDIAIEPSDSFDDALMLARDQKYDVILTEAVMPDGKAENFIAKLRRARISTPVLVVSAYCNTPEKRTALLKAGADDAISMPYDAEEVRARIYTAVRRINGHSSNIIQVNELSINLDARTVSVKNQPVKLTKTEFCILELLALRQGKLQTRENLLRDIYINRDEPNIRLIEVYIHKLRKKLADASGGKHFITNIWGQGYILKPDNADTPLAASG